MRFLDECDLWVEAGDGGNGCVAFRREKFVPFGGPSGGNGGRGGDVTLEANPGLSTLYDLQHLRRVRAGSGRHGQGRDCDGRSGHSRVLQVPLGTIVFDAETHQRLTELTTPSARVVVAQGGRGGRGNRSFVTPVDRAPRRAEPGLPGERRHLRLELKVMADVGLLGFPNVGKSTLIRAVSRARPKVADYPFTTLEPHLGVVTIGDSRRGLGRSFVLADIPGLVPGASEGHGLGIRFLRHIERTRAFLHLVTVAPERDALADYRAVRTELSDYNPDLLGRPEVVALSKSDLPDVRDVYPELRERFASVGVDLRLVSAAAHLGLDDLMLELGEKLLI